MKAPAEREKSAEAFLTLPFVIGNEMVDPRGKANNPLSPGGVQQCDLPIRGVAAKGPEQRCCQYHISDKTGLNHKDAPVWYAGR